MEARGGQPIVVFYTRRLATTRVLMLSQGTLTSKEIVNICESMTDVSGGDVGGGVTFCLYASKWPSVSTYCKGDRVILSFDERNCQLHRPLLSFTILRRGEKLVVVHCSSEKNENKRK